MMSLKISWREGSLDFKDFSLILKKKNQKKSNSCSTKMAF